MADIPDDLKYTKDHEWVRIADDGTATIGITDYAQESLGDITFVELPGEGDTYQSGETFGVVESVKAASDLFLPVDGEVQEVNSALDEAPESVNTDPYGEGWMVKIKTSDTSQLDTLLTPDQYRKIV